MMKIEQILPYVPHGLEYCRVMFSPVTLKEEIKVMGQVSLKGDIHNIYNNVLCDYSNFKYLPVLHPLENITEEHIKNIAIYEDRGLPYFIETVRTGFVETIIFQKLIEWKYDVYGLIDRGEAISYETIKNLKL